MEQQLMNLTRAYTDPDIQMTKTQYLAPKGQIVVLRELAWWVVWVVMFGSILRDDFRHDSDVIVLREQISMVLASELDQE